MGRRTFDVLLPTAVFLLLIPSIDETIQLFVPGRAGMITDAMIDCCGAATGVVRLIGQNVCPRWGHRRRSMPLFQPFKFRARF